LNYGATPVTIGIFSDGPRIGNPDSVLFSTTTELPKPFPSTVQQYLRVDNELDHVRLNDRKNLKGIIKEYEQDNGFFGAQLLMDRTRLAKIVANPTKYAGLAAKLKDGVFTKGSTNQFSEALKGIDKAAGLDPSKPIGAIMRPVIAGTLGYSAGGQAYDVADEIIRAREGIFNPQFTANTIPTTRVTTSTSTGSASTYSNPSTITVGGLIVNNGVTTNTLTVSSTSTFNGSIIYGAVLISSTYTILSTDYLVGVNTSTSTCSITLPSVSTTTAGRTLVIKDETGNATANPIHISASSGETIDGLSVFTVDSDHGAVTLYCTSTGWHVT
jgi:hypothetical protein